MAYTCNSSPWLREEDYEFEAYVKRQESKLMNCCSGYVPVVTEDLDKGNLQEKELILAHTAWVPCYVGKAWQRGQVTGWSQCTHTQEAE